MAAGMRISIVIGNPNPGGRTTRVAEAAAHAVVKAVGAGGRAELETIELAHVANRLFAWEDDELAELCRRVASSALIVPACPVYKASSSVVPVRITDHVFVDPGNERPKG